MALVRKIKTNKKQCIQFSILPSSLITWKKNLKNIDSRNQELNKKESFSIKKNNIF